MPSGKLALRLGLKGQEALKGTVTQAALQHNEETLDSYGRGGFGSSLVFEEFGVRYLGPIDGHDLPLLIETLEFAKTCDQPIVIHVITKKGKGFNAALDHPEKFHGTGGYNPATGESLPSKPGTPPKYQDVFGQTMVKLCQKDTSVVGITAAMPSGTGLSALEKAMPDRYFDVGIAEEHGVLFAAGMATMGYRPVCAIYSTFLQRAYDMIIHDVALQNLPVTFCMDRAGLSANDGPTHHGLFDIAYLSCVPGIIAMAPGDEDELADMMFTATHQNQPAFIRYPRGSGEGVAVKEQPALIEIGKAEVRQNFSNSGKPKVAFFPLGPMRGHRRQGHRGTRRGKHRCRNYQSAFHQADRRRHHRVFRAGGGRDCHHRGSRDQGAATAASCAIIWATAASPRRWCASAGRTSSSSTHRRWVTCVKSTASPVPTRLNKSAKRLTKRAKPARGPTRRLARRSAGNDDEPALPQLRYGMDNRRPARPQ